MEQVIITAEIQIEKELLFGVTQLILKKDGNTVIQNHWTVLMLVLDLKILFQESKSNVTLTMTIITILKTSKRIRKDMKLN